MNAIQTEDLTKYYGRTRGAEHIDLTVGQGDFFGFIGPNGAGQSTTIRMLLGLIRPSQGRARIGFWGWTRHGSGRRSWPGQAICPPRFPSIRACG